MMKTKFSRDRITEFVKDLSREGQMRRRVPSADHGKFKGDERQGCEQGGIRSIRFKYHARILPFWNKGERQNQLVVCHACE